MQIVTGFSNGQICVLYSPDVSLNGAKLPLNKGPPRRATIEDMSDAVAAPTIITPHALPMFRDTEVGRSAKRKREKERMDPEIIKACFEQGVRTLQRKSSAGAYNAR